MSWSGKYKNGESFTDLTDDELNAFESDIDIESVSENAAPTPASKPAAPVKAVAPRVEPVSQAQMNGIRALSGAMFPYGTEMEDQPGATAKQKTVAALKDVGSFPGRFATGLTYGLADALGGQSFGKGMADGMTAGGSPDAGSATNVLESIVKDPYGGAAMIAAPLAAPAIAGVAGMQTLAPVVSKLGPVVKSMKTFARSRPVVTALGANAAGGAAMGAGVQASENVYNNDPNMQDVGSSAGIGALIGGIGTGATMGAKAGFNKLRESGVGRMAGRILENVQDDMRDRVKGLAESTIGQATAGKLVGLKKAISEAFASDAASTKARLDDIYADLDEKFAAVTNANEFEPQRWARNNNLEQIYTRSVSPYGESIGAESEYIHLANQNGKVNNMDIPARVRKDEIMPKLAQDVGIPGFERDRTIYPGSKKPDDATLGSGYISPSQTREMMSDLYRYAQDYNGPNKAEVMDYVNILNRNMSKRLDAIYTGTRPIRAEDLPTIRKQIEIAADPGLMKATDEQLMAMTPKQIDEQLVKGLPEGDIQRNVTQTMIDLGQSGAGLSPNMRIAQDAAASTKALAEGIGRTQYPGISAPNIKDIGTLRAASYASAPVASLSAKVLQWADSPLNRIRVGNAGAGAIRALQKAAPIAAPYLASANAKKPAEPASDKNGNPKGAQDPDTISSLRHLVDLASTGRNMTETETDRVSDLVDLANAGALSAKDSADIKMLYGRYRQ